MALIPVKMDAINRTQEVRKITQVLPLLQPVVSDGLDPKN